MMKKLFFLCACLGMVLSVFSNTKTAPLYAESNTISEEEETPLEYESEKDTGAMLETRIYKNISIANIQETFKAPSGCVLTFEGISENIARIKKEIQSMDAFKDADSIKMIDVCAYRIIGNSEMYSNSDTKWGISFDNFESFVSTQLSNLELYEIEDKISDVDISARLELEVWSEDMIDGIDSYRFVFYTNTYHVEKYQPGDTLCLIAGYYIDGDDDRVNIDAEYAYDFFNSKYGFKTDGRTERSWDPGNYDEVYTIKYYDKDTNIILGTETAETGYGIEIENIPEKPLTIYAVMTFKQDGIEYSFTSNEVTIGNLFTGLYIDGYNNRDTVGINETHTLRVNPTFELDDLKKASINLTLEGTEYNPVNKTLSGEEGCIEKDFFEFDFNYNVPGDYILTGTISLELNTISYYNMAVSLPIKVSETPTHYTSIEDALALNETERIDAVAGGESINLEATISKDVLNDGEEPVYEWHLSRLNVCEIVTDNNKATLNPVGGGVVVVTLTCSATAFSGISKTLTINVIDNITSITKLDIPNEFHYSGKDLTIGLNIEKYNKISNFKPTWSVTNKAGEEVPFIDNGDLTITLTAPAQDDYTITLLYDGVEIDTQTIEIRDVNVDEFIRQNLVWLILVTLAFMGIVIFMKLTLDKKGSLVARIEKTKKKFEAVDKDSKDVVKELNKVRLSILSDIDYARNLNMNAMNEFEKTIRYLGKSLADIVEITKNKETMTTENYEEVYARLTKDLSKAYIVAKEIEDARELSLSNSLKANENNIVQIKEEKKSKKKKSN